VPTPIHPDRPDVGQQCQFDDKLDAFGDDVHFAVKIQVFVHEVFVKYQMKNRVARKQQSGHPEKIKHNKTIDSYKYKHHLYICYMLPLHGWIQLCHCGLPTSHKVVFVVQEYTTYLCRACAPKGVQVNPHLRFCTVRMPSPDSPELSIHIPLLPSSRSLSV